MYEFIIITFLFVGLIAVLLLNPNLGKSLSENQNEKKNKKKYNYVRYWNGKIYSCHDSELLFANGSVHIYKTRFGEYFMVSIADYGDIDYIIMGKKDVRRMLFRWANEVNYNEIKNVLESEYLN